MKNVGWLGVAGWLAVFLAAVSPFVVPGVTGTVWGFWAGLAGVGLGLVLSMVFLMIAITCVETRDQMKKVATIERELAWREVARKDAQQRGLFRHSGWRDAG